MQLERMVAIGTDKTGQATANRYPTDTLESDSYPRTLVLRVPELCRNGQHVLFRV